MSITIFEDAEFGGESKEFLEDAEDLGVSLDRENLGVSLDQYGDRADLGAGLGRCGYNER